MKIGGTILLLALTALSIEPRAQSATFYVATNGNDSNAGTIGSPWRTVQKAANTLRAGQTALIRGGTYSENNIRFTNSGTSGSRITLKNYPGETPIIDGGFTSSSGINPVFYLDGRNGADTLAYWTFDGLTVRRGSRANYFIARDDRVDNIIIQNGICENYVTDDNAACIFLSPGTSNITITNNVIRGRILGGSFQSTGAGIIIFRHTGSLTITKNEIYNQVQGIYYKHNDLGNMTTLVENNKIHDISSNGLLWTMHDAVIRNNVIYAANRAIRVFEEAGTCDTQAAHGNQILHNTLVDNQNGIFLATQSCTGARETLIRDNLIFNATNGEHRAVSIYPFETSTDTSSTTLTRNLISTAQQSSPIRVLGNYYGLTSVPGSVTSNGNIGTSPNFRNYAGRDYTLLAGPGKNAASDGLDMGVVNFCAVGVGGGACSPSPPTRLRVVP